MTWSSCLRHDAPFSLQGSVAEVEMVADFQVFPKIGGKTPKWMVYNGKPYENS